jgi:hypothetical protein
VACPDGQGGLTYTSGTENGGHGHSRPTVTVDGNLKAVAAMLSRMWNRHLTVPPDRANQKVERTVSGTEEEIAHALGLHLAPKA